MSSFLISSICDCIVVSFSSIEFISLIKHVLNFVWEILKLCFYSDSCDLPAAPAPTGTDWHRTGSNLLRLGPIYGPYRVSNGLCRCLTRQRPTQTDMDRHRPALDWSRSKKVKADPLGASFPRSDVVRCRCRGEIARNAVVVFERCYYFFTKISYFRPF